MYMKKSIVQEKSYIFAIQVVRAYRHIVLTQKEFVLTRQFLRSGTSIGANIYEGEQAQSRPDFISKMSIALKEAHETVYWINILHDTEYLPDDRYHLLDAQLMEIVKLLTSIIKTSRK